jgi:surfeit locus 1 family protein
VSAAAWRRTLLIPALLTAAGLVVLISLGSWQMERKAWKEALIAKLTERLRAAPQALPARQTWMQLDPAIDEFRRVAVRATFLPVAAPRDREARLYTSGSALRDDVKSPGVFVFAPARLADGGVVVVNRGYLPEPRPGRPAAPVAAPEGPVDLVGVLRWPEAPRWFVSSYNATDDLWFVRDHLAMAAQKGWGTVAPFYIEQEAPAPAGGLPKPGRLRVELPNDHLQYALTWYGLAVVLAAIFAVWVARLRKPAEGRSGG